MSKIILTGDRPTGKLHVGHYVGSLKGRVELQNSGKYDECLHDCGCSGSDRQCGQSREKVRQNIIEVALITFPADWIRKKQRF